MTNRYVLIPCHREAPAGYRCNRGGHDDTHCVLVPRWWNLHHGRHYALHR